MQVIITQNDDLFCLHNSVDHAEQILPTLVNLTSKISDVQPAIKFPVVHP
jgi:hypothetical protein